MQQLKNTLEVCFGEKVKVDGNVAKLHKKGLDEVDIYHLEKIRKDNAGKIAIKIKRSGTGLTIITVLK